MNHTNLINKLMVSLFAAEERRLAAFIIELNDRNKVAQNASIDGFLYNGKAYMPSSGQLVIPSKGEAKPTLHCDLQDEMETWVKDMKSIHDDSLLVRQMLFRILQPCRSETEIRDALPECLVSMAGLPHHPRCENAGFTLRGDHRAMRQFAKLMDKIQVYSVTGMLY